MPYRPTEKTEARRLATRERIVAAALDRVASGGYASAGVQAVAARAGVAVGTVYRHFPSKGDAFARVLEDGVRDAELRPHDSLTVASALVGALAESLVGPLSTANGGSRAALIATLVQFSQEALPSAHERVHA